MCAKRLNGAIVPPCRRTGLSGLRAKRPYTSRKGLLLVRTILVTIAIGITVLLIGGCGVSASPTATQPPTATSTTTARSTIPWTPLPVSPTPMSLGVSRQEVYQALLNLNIGFLPLNKHTNEWYSTMLPNGDFSFDIFGSSSRVEAVEMWFRLDAPIGQTARSMRALYAVTMPERQAEVEGWVERTLATLSPEGKARDQTEINGVYATLQLVPRLRQVFLSIDIAK